MVDRAAREFQEHFTHDARTLPGIDGDDDVRYAKNSSASGLHSGYELVNGTLLHERRRKDKKKNMKLSPDSPPDS